MDSTNNSNNQNEEIENQKQPKEQPKIKKFTDGVGKQIHNAEETGVKGVNTGVQIAGKGIDVASKSVQLTGKGIQMIGKGVELAGQGVEWTGSKMQEETQKGVDFATHFVGKRRSLRDYFWKSKKGMIIGCADNDPSGILVYTQVGAIVGFKLLWLCIIAWPLLTAVEEMSARIGVVTKKGVNQIVIENYGWIWAWLAAIIILVCNTFTMGADIAAMADVASILTKIPEIIFIIVMGLLFFYLLWKKGYRAISNYLFILTPFFLLYIASAFLLHVPWGAALRDTFIPQFHSLNLSMALIAVAFLGTTITPFLIFWETTQEIEENKTVNKLKEESSGTTFGMFFSQFITFFIIVAAATAFAGFNHQLGTVREAALALKPFGRGSFLLFSLGILGSGLLAIPVLAASTGYTFSETLGWKRGLDKTVHEAKGFYAVMILTLIIGLSIALFKFNPVVALLYSQVLNGLLMPILVLLLLLITNNKKIMGNYTNKFWSNFFGILAFLVIVAADIALIAQWIK